MGENEMQVEEVPQCPLCGSERRKTLYAELTDRLFGAPGEWTLKECCHCGLVYLDPRPMQEDIEKAYETYYTHQHMTTSGAHANFWRAILKKISRVPRNFVENALGFAQERSRIQDMYLKEERPGTLLDIGCGQGRFLDHMQRRGWFVEGVEPDPKAAEIAHATYGVTVRIGDLADASYPSQHFDAITMNHVIEHVHEPLGLLAECHRILKPNGVLVVTTPNIGSLGSRVFARNWRGLEPPRHLQLFSAKTLKGHAEQTGYGTIGTWTTAANAGGVFIGSLDISISGTHDMESKPPTHRILLMHLFEYGEAALVKLFPEMGEEMVLWAEK